MIHEFHCAPPEVIHDMNPQWFNAALSSPADCGSIDVADVPIHYRGWGARGQHGILLIHGGAAHARWWDHIAPLISSTRRIVAIDLSGHGDSGHRPSYSLDMWVEEAMTVIEDAGIFGPPIIIGHSLGGFITMRAINAFGSHIGGAITIDSPFRERLPEEATLRYDPFSSAPIYSNRSEILQRFHPVPDQETLDFVSAHIAENSIREVGTGWSWKFDPKVLGRATLWPKSFSRFDGPIAFFRAEFGLVTEEMTDFIFKRMGRVAPLIEIPNAGHAVMLDQPLALVTGIRTLLAEWDSLPLSN